MFHNVQPRAEAWCIHMHSRCTSGMDGCICVI